ncbi:UDP-N-acetylmuramoyl-L-alanyl-D-glutamate--2,6-diaminopimelate ligase [Clostridium formicaceticum]|uniref:UDP-N-acetylmuramoyl-L-alanyl-D-glutamate--2,6-diaminopimelate ligase n=1 Tax=Clostridium formicaceticum TaxID=1497 RepID=A0AAC9WGI4_9CLOT|nr:UDP-N-acetylmuramoyl-L-alanyl-D-glutamate--2,6-diaminopimelate ligase [Clostridium formicaceticum]AOY77433.1 UDP-N-acetylmuramoyl-L-alanyl-D-glutamate--2,6-diaminopimelate ligase [Clostridium formicaceticum]ARE87987.1 UDP-N-acetylmuramoyl-L-alanyl-D-glutamate--2,6-diaminopimelate ligase [Clostridium formicaceticum]
MLLTELLKGMVIEEIVGNDKINIDDIGYDSRNLKKNSLFLCIKGFKTDGHLYIKDAIRRGATAVMVERTVEVEGVTVIRVKDTRKAMAAIASRFYGHPSRSLNLIGVTGTNGKTSTTYMIKKILETCGKKTGLIGTISNWIGEEKMDASRTTPEALDLQRLFKNMLEVEADSCVMEVSSHSLELQRVEECEFKVGVFTNLTPEHLDFHKTLEDYRNAKKKLFYKTSLCNVINIDDLDGRKIAEEMKDLSTPLLTYGIREQAEITARNIVMTMTSVSFDLITPKYTEKIELNIPGMFTVYNGLAAIAACYSMNIDIKNIKKGLKNLRGVAGRLEAVEEFKDFAVIVDYAHTPDALENVLKSVKDFTNNKLITVFGCGGDRDQTKRPVMGEIAGIYSDLTIITSDNPRTEDSMKILKMIEEGMNKTKGKYHVIEDRREAIVFALKSATKGDIILIAGKGHETYQIIGDSVFEFDDRKVALEIAKEDGII